MQKVIDWYFLIVSSAISIMSISFCLHEKNLGNILLFCFSIMVTILYIINIFKASPSFRLFVKCVSVLLSVIMALILPISLIMLTFKYEILFYIAICFCILNIILSLCMKMEVHKWIAGPEILIRFPDSIKGMHINFPVPSMLQSK